MVANSHDTYRYLTRYALFLIIGSFLLFIIILQYIVIQEKKLSDKIYPNVYIDNTPVGYKTKQEASQVFQKKNQELQNISITVLYEDKAIATFSAEKLNIRSNGEEVIERSYLIGRSTHGPSRLYQKIASLFTVKSFHFTTHIIYDDHPIAPFIETLKDEYDKPAKNALFTFENGRVVSFKDDEEGFKIDTKKFSDDINAVIDSLNTKIQSQTITLTGTAIDPEITLKNSNDFGIEEEIGQGLSDFSHSIPERIHNIVIASSKFHGILIPKDKVFSFNDIIGDISSNTGYKPAYIIKNGKTVLGDGGGVCQVSTTFFRAALNSGLPIVERTAHAYRVVYYEHDSKPGFDATVFSPSVDLKFKNDTPTPILILTEVDQSNNLLTIRFYGKKDDRKIEISDVTLYDEQPPPPPSNQDDPTLKKGITKQVDFAAWGAKSKFSYRVLKQDQVSFEKTFYSVYRPWQAVFLVGTQD